MADYPNHIEIAQKVMRQQVEINDLKARIDAALKLCDLPWGCFVDRPEVQRRIRWALTGKEVSRG